MAMHLIQTTRRLEKAHRTVHSKLLIQERLAQLLSSIQPGTLKLPDPHTLTFTTTDHLDPDPAYSGTLPVTLSLQHRALILHLAGRPEILLDNVNNMHLTLIAPNTALSTLRLRLITTELPFQLAFAIHTKERKRRLSQQGASKAKHKSKK